MNNLSRDLYAIHYCWLWYNNREEDGYKKYLPKFLTFHFGKKSRHYRLTGKRWWNKAF